MNRYKVIIAYDGTDFCGWQAQINGVSIAQILQLSFKKVFGHEVVVLGASRTDAGVHAVGQVALVRTPLCINELTFASAWNAQLPSSITIRSMQKVSSDFHPFYNIVSKMYEYRISEQRVIPTRSRYVWHVTAKMNWARFEHALSFFKGTHDFSAFATDSHVYENTQCTIERIDFLFDDVHNEYVVRIIGNRFLRHMVRRIIGAAVRVASRDMPDSIIMDAFKKKVPDKCFLTVPAHGLTLCEIVYKT